MELPPVSASLGAMGSLAVAGKLETLLDTELKVEIRKLRDWLVLLSEVRDPPVTARIWMKDVRELSYDMENCVDAAEPDWISKMSGFKARVKEATKRYDRCMLGSIRTCTTTAIDFQLPMVDGQRRPDLVVGLQAGPLAALCQWLTDGDKELKVSSIVGVGGIGKTTLAKQLWRQHEAGDYFDCRAFVRTAKKPDMRRILRSILAQVRPHQPPDTNEVHELIYDITTHLQEKRYFLIIDDLWAISVWDVARRAFPEGNGSRIITTTEIKDVALACCSYQLKCIFKMEPLSAIHSKELFTSGVLGSGEEKSCQVDEVSEEIIKRCAGLPLAIISISSVLASQREANTVQNREQIKNSLPTNTTPVEALKKVLNFCYNCLPSCLQTCLLYLCMYPENYIILKNDIMKQWVAAGFVLAPTEKDKMEVAGNYFDKLVNMGLIQHIDVDYSNEVYYYAVHHTVHDLIRSKSREENFVTVIDYSERTGGFSNRVSSLSLQFGSATYATRPESIGLSQVRSLAFIGLKSCYGSILDYKVLRFLILHMWADQPGTGLDLKPTSELVLLRSLQVTCNDTVHLPDLVQGPKHLEILEINARLAAIPGNIVHLRSWLHLRLGIGTELPDLTGTLEIVTLNPPITLDDSICPHDSVKTIELLSLICKIPKWTGQLTNLCILKFVLGEVQSEDISNLENLSFLTVLSLHVQRPTTGPIVFTPGKFDALEYFEFRCGVLRLKFEEGTMSNLQRLKLGFNAHRGEQYGDSFVGIEHLSNVKEISGIIGVATGAEQRDFDDAESALKKAVGKHGRIVNVKRADMVEELHVLAEIQHEIPEKIPSTTSEQPGSPNQESRDVRGPPEKQREIPGKHPLTSSEQPGSSIQESHDVCAPPEKRRKIQGKHQSTSPGSPKQDYQTEIKQDSCSDCQLTTTDYLARKNTDRMLPPGAPSKNKYTMLQQSAAAPHKNEHLCKKERSMASLAIWLAKSVLEGALSKAQAAIKQEVKLRESAQRDLVFITGEFEMMHSFLKVAKPERVENPVVMTWVKQIRKLAYAVEDYIEFVVHLDRKPSWWFRMIPSCVAPPLPLDEALEEIKQLKCMVEDVSKRNERYNLISDTGSEPMVVQPATSTGVGCAITTSNMLSEARDASKRQLVLGCDLTQLITKKDNMDDHLQLQVVSVWGSGGHHGTTSIIRKTYTDPEVYRNFTCRAWVELMHPFNPHKFILNLMVQFYANSCEVVQKKAPIGTEILTMMQTPQEDIFKEFERQVTGERYLLVLEGLSSMADWDAITPFLPHRENGSRIIVSTHQSEIASLCIGHSYQISELKQFSVEHSVCALFKKGSNAAGGKGKKPTAGDSLLLGNESQMYELHQNPANACLLSTQVMSVWGIAGVGKSALVRDLYNDLSNSGDTKQPLDNAIIEHLAKLKFSQQFNKYYWVDVSHPFNLRDFSRSLLSDFHSGKDPIEECRQLLKQHRCLVVIDDIQSKSEWDLIQTYLIPRSSESVIIVITTDASIATYCANSKELVFNVKGLEPGAAFDLFKEVHQTNPSSFLKHHPDVEVEKLILKCGGLPKVIIAIAGVLAKQTVRWMDTVLSLNQRFMHHLETKPEYDSLRNLFGWMHSHFHNCPDSLKPCIFYSSMFPQDQIIRRRRLVRRWIAEGYCRDSDEESAEENGEKQFSELLDLIIIKQVPQFVEFNDNRMAFCQVNSFIREYIISLRKEENLVFELRGSCALTTKRTGRHLIILEDWDRDRIVFERIDFTRLRSLTVFGKWESFFISESMKLLQVLDLEDASRVEYDDLKKMVKWFPCLKFLSLRGQHEICRLPSSLDHLRQLQTLDVRGTSIVTLPKSLTKLQKLQYIRAGMTVPVASGPPAPSSWFCRSRRIVGVEVPRKIGELAALHTLGVVNVSASGGEAILEEFKKLTQLRKLGVSGINKYNSKKFVTAIKDHGHLESLSVWLDKGHEGCLGAMTSLPCKNLESLKLYGLGDKLPQFSDQLSKLRKLDLEMATLKKDDIEFLAKVQKLSILGLHVKQLSIHFMAELYGNELPSYERLKVLEISGSSSSLHVIFGPCSMTSLELLKLDCSSGLLYAISGLNNLSELKEVLLMGTNDETLKIDLEIQLLNHPKRPAVKLA